MNDTVSPCSVTLTRPGGCPAGCETIAACVGSATTLETNKDITVSVAQSFGYQPIVMRVEGDDKAGLGGRVTQAWEMAGINLHGLVMSVVGGKFIGYATFDSVADANKAATILAELGTA